MKYGFAPQIKPRIIFNVRPLLNLLRAATKESSTVSTLWDTLLLAALPPIISRVLQEAEMAAAAPLTTEGVRWHID